MAIENPNTEIKARIFNVLLGEFHYEEDIVITERDLLDAYEDFKFVMENVPSGTQRISFK